MVCHRVLPAPSFPSRLCSVGRRIQSISGPSQSGFSGGLMDPDWCCFCRNDTTWLMNALMYASSPLKMLSKAENVLISLSTNLGAATAIAGLASST
eukprot:1627811-Pyramimonas_sp.AAC.1